MQPLDLISSAKRLLGESRLGAPRQSDLKRALSTAYYAMLHTLCRNCADSFVGTTTTPTTEDTWIQAYRAVEHGYAKSQLQFRPKMATFPTDIQDFANQFVELQENRHRADYDPSSRFTRHDVVTAIDAASVAVTNAEIRHSIQESICCIVRAREGAGSRV